ncbi:MAG: PLP-dependent aminotransferase family protein [Pseudomonadota bacterium]
MEAPHAAFANAFRQDIPPPTAPWAGFPTYNFVGGHNAAETVPVDELIAAVTARLQSEGRTLATYSLESGPQGYHPLRSFLVDRLKQDAGIACTEDEILITSGSLQGMELINAAMLSPGDTVVIEEENYGGVLSRLKRRQAEIATVPVDHDGMRMDALAETLESLKARGITPKYIYTIPTVQNPTATVMPEDRRREMLRLAGQYNVPVFEDDCYANLTWDGERPPAIHALDTDGRVVYIGSFSKSIAPALRVGYVVAPWPVLAQLLPLKTDAGSGAIEQMMLAEYCPTHFDAHVKRQRAVLKDKLDNLIEALSAAFGTTVEFQVPQGGIFLWVRFPEAVDTARLTQAAAEAGIAVNPGPEWSVAGDANRCIRICYANPSKEVVRDGIFKLAEVCHATFGVPQRSANISR